MDIRRVSFAHPDAVALNDRVQREYAVRYGDEGDVTPLEPAMFEPPSGLYLIVYDDLGTPLSTGGWRAQDANAEGYTDGDAEVKRMYVVPEARRRGLSRLVLAALEDDARTAGRTRMVLETGVRLPEAIALYVSSGYQLCARFGPYRFDELSRCYAKPLVTAAVPGPTTAPATTTPATTAPGPDARRGTATR
ncbi:GNAT family N-acetyltransferase [Streptomyces sp. TS71-3]|uniref:GNAT family N-acetyltransferase n=1 Tax=Streptomyces sp. TS71-3 TaxID=2733862 RepID=UPI001B13E51A|nr:GNAT family N-acetyltransferase [Streptomyces sp. TS71-3]GHJ42612.1 N-acetyltransferase [Streptomyces sp. TS71-3]